MTQLIGPLLWLARSHGRCIFSCYVAMIDFQSQIVALNRSSAG
jgi:hypothetical protein